MQLGKLKTSQGYPRVVCWGMTLGAEATPAGRFCQHCGQRLEASRSKLKYHKIFKGHKVEAKKFLNDWKRGS